MGTSSSQSSRSLLNWNCSMPAVGQQIYLSFSLSLFLRQASALSQTAFAKLLMNSSFFQKYLLVKNWSTLRVPLHLKISLPMLRAFSRKLRSSLYLMLGNRSTISLRMTPEQSMRMKWRRGRNISLLSIRRLCSYKSLGENRGVEQSKYSIFFRQDFNFQRLFLVQPKESMWAGGCLNYNRQCGHYNTYNKRMQLLIDNVNSKPKYQGRNDRSPANTPNQNSQYGNYNNGNRQNNSYNMNGPRNNQPTSNNYNNNNYNNYNNNYNNRNNSSNQLNRNYQNNNNNISSNYNNNNNTSNYYNNNNSNRSNKGYDGYNNLGNNRYGNNRNNGGQGTEYGNSSQSNWNNTSYTQNTSMNNNPTDSFIRQQESIPNPYVQPFPSANYNNNYNNNNYNNRNDNYNNNNYNRNNNFNNNYKDRGYNNNNRNQSNSNGRTNNRGINNNNYNYNNNTANNSNFGNGDANYQNERPNANILPNLDYGNNAFGQSNSIDNNSSDRQFNRNNNNNSNNNYNNRNNRNNNRNYNNNNYRDQQQRRPNTTSEAKFDISNPPPLQAVQDLKIPQECRRPHNIHYLPHQYASDSNLFRPFNSANLKSHDIKLEINARNHEANPILTFPDFKQSALIQEKVVGWTATNGIDYGRFQTAGDELVTQIIKSFSLN